MTDTLLPTVNLVTDNELKSDYTLITITPKNATTWAYKLVLPKNWVQDDNFEQVVPQQDVMAQIGLFGQNETDQTVAIQVWATVIPFEVNLLDWLKLVAETSEMELIETVERVAETGQVVEALVHHLQGNQAMLTRLTAFSDGNRIFLINGMSDEKLYQANSELLGLIAISFTPAQLTGDYYMEDVILFEDIARRIAFYHPISWQSEDISPNTTRSGVTLKLSDETDVLGYLRIQTVEMGATPVQVFQSIQQDLHNSGVVTDSLALLEENGDWNEVLWVGEAKINNNINECVIAYKPFLISDEIISQQIRSDKTQGIAFVLLCPQREQSPYVWMRSKRALEIAIATSRICYNEKL